MDDLCVNVKARPIYWQRSIFENDVYCYVPTRNNELSLVNCCDCQFNLSDDCFRNKLKKLCEDVEEVTGVADATKDFWPCHNKSVGYMINDFFKKHFLHEKS